MKSSPRGLALTIGCQHWWESEVALSPA